MNGVAKPLFFEALQGEAGRGRSSEAFLELLVGTTSNLSAALGVFAGSLTSAFGTLLLTCNPSNWARSEETGLIDSPSVLWSPFPLMIPGVQAHVKGGTGRSVFGVWLPRHVKSMLFCPPRPADVLLGPRLTVRLERFRFWITERKGGAGDRVSVCGAGTTKRVDEGFQQQD